MSFLGIAAGAVKGLLNWGSETLPCETMYSGSQQWKLLPGPCGSAPRCPVVIHKHAPLLPCTALARPAPSPRRTWPFSLDFSSELNRGCADEQNHPMGIRKNKQKEKKKKPHKPKPKNLFLVGADYYFTVLAKNRTQNRSLHPTSKALSFQCALKIKQPFLLRFKWQKQPVGQMIIKNVKPSGDTHLMIRKEVKKSFCFYTGDFCCPA